MSVHSPHVWLGLAVLIGAAIAPSFIFWHPTYAYTSGKQGKLRSVALFRRVDRWVRIFAVVVGGLAILRVDPPLAEWHHSVQWLDAGIVITLAGMALLIAAKRTLGFNYSPGFDAYVPFRIVDDGVYRYLRHPMYVARLVIAAGACVMTGSVWLAVAWFVAFDWYWRAAAIEESELTRWFPNYRVYAMRTGGFLPGFRARPALVPPRNAAPKAQTSAPEVLTLSVVDAPRATSTSDAA
jgi:protein-S-isoprenylcysteine O-methyltransferase Ste14